MEPGYTYRARLVRVVDGDTQELAIDLGFDVVITVRVRLLGVNTPELHGAIRAAGLTAKAFATTWYTKVAGELWPIVVKTHQSRQQEKYGRWLATVYRNDDPVSLNDALLASGHAVAYMTEVQ